jgi:glycosyltransferase involved in cell wall biosynthesis
MEDRAHDDPRLVSFVLVAYNQERYVREAVASALAQTYSPLEIIISDDGSTDATLARAAEALEGYAGPHRVRLVGTQRNRGFARHLNYVNLLATGDLVVIAAGDDVSEPERVAKLARAASTASSVHLCIFSGATFIDEHGAVQPPVGSARRGAAISPASIARGGDAVLGASNAWTRRLFEDFGPLHPRIFQEDAAIPFRAALAGQVMFVDEPLVRYRRHSEGMWSGIGHMTSTAAARAWYANWARNLIALNIGFRRDLRTALRRGLVTSAQAAVLGELLARRRWEVHAERALHRSSPLHAIGIVLRGLARGMTLRRAARWMLMGVAMRSYLRIMSRTR